MNAPASASVTRARCHLHPEREAAARCVSCGRSFCRECVTPLDMRMYCAACYREKTSVKTVRKRDWFVISTLAQLIIGLFGLWFTAWLLGQTLLELPDDFHEGTIWKKFVP